MERRPLCTMESPTYPKRSARWSRVFKTVRRLGAAASISAAIALAPGCYVSSAPGEPGNDAGSYDAQVEDTGSGGDGDVIVEDGGVDGGDGGVIVEDGGVDGGDGGTTDADVTGRVIELCEPDYRLSGDAPAPDYLFACGVDIPADAPELAVPFYGYSNVCTGDGVASWARIVVDSPMRLSFSFPSGGWYATVDIYAPDGSLVAQLIPEERPCVALDAEAGTWTVAARAMRPEIEDPVSFEFAVDQVWGED